MFVRFLQAVAAALALLASGCGKDPDAGKETIRGTVTLKGSAIKDGAIVTLSGMDGQAAAATAVTAGGKFDVPKAFGLPPGRYLVRVSLGDGKTAANPVDPSQPPGPGGGTNIISKELVPADWNTKSKHEVTVKAGGPNEFEFVIP